MSIFYSFLKLPLSDKKLIIETIILMVKVKFMLSFCSFPKIRKHYEQAETSDKKDLSIFKLTWALNVVNHILPGITCLNGALTGYYLLLNHGYSGQVKIGVVKTSSSEFEAHAWLEYNEEVLLGVSEKDYILLYDFNS